MRSQLKRIISRFFIPQYDEITLFATSLAFVFICFVSLDVVVILLESFFKDVKIYSQYIGILYAVVYFLLHAFILIGGILYPVTLSIYHVFTERRKTYYEKSIILGFVITVNSFSGLFGLWYILNQGHKGLLLFFPIWNALNGMILSYLLKSGVITVKSISDENVTFLEVIISASITMLTFIVCHFYLQIFPAITFSICVAYASNVNRNILDLFLRKRK